MNNEALKAYSGGVRIPPPRQRQADDTDLVIWGWVGTMLFAPAGLIIGIILWTRGNRRAHGIAQTIVSGVWCLLLAVIIIVALGTAVSADPSYAACLDQARTAIEAAAC